MYYKLVWLDGGTESARGEWNLIFPCIIGRSEEAGILLNDPSISRRHCKFSINAHEEMVVQDLESKNGLYVRDERVKTATIILGEKFQIGALTVKVEEIPNPLPESASRASSADSMYETQRVPTFDLG